MNIKDKLETVRAEKLKNFTQKAAHRLLNAQGRWLSRRDLARTISSAPSRVRDLRMEKFGGFRVECRHASELQKRGGEYFYRINPHTVTHRQLERIFNI